MALSLQTHADSYESTSSVSVPLLDWESCYRATSMDPKNTTLASIVAPMGSEQDYRSQFITLKNVYSNTSIASANRSASTKGVRMYIQKHETWDVTDSGDAGYNVKLPVSCSIAVDIPENSLVTASEVRSLINRTLAFTFDSTDRLATLMRGALVPKDL